MAELTEAKVHRELDQMVVELEEVIKKSQEAPPVLPPTILNSTIEEQAQRRLEALRAVRGLWAMRPLDDVERTVPPLQEELLGMPAPDFLDATATMLLQVTNGCSPDMGDPDKQHIGARVLGTYFYNQDAGDVDPDALVRGFHEMVLCFDRKHLGDERSSGFALNLANVVALARIGAQSLLNV